MRLWLLIPVLCLGNILLGQDADYGPNRSNNFWTSASFSWKPFDELGSRNDFLEKIRSSAEIGHRTEDFYGETSQLFLDLNFRRKVTDWLRAGVEYRFSLRDSDSRNRSRIQFFAYNTWEVGQFDVRFKTRYQHRFVDVTGERHIWRNRVSLTYRTPDFRINPKVSAESFTHFSFRGMEYRGIRYSLAANVNLPNGQEVDFGIKEDREIGVYEPRYRFIGFVSYGFDL